MMAEKKKPVGRPKVHDLDSAQIEQLSGFGCTNREIASFFRCSETTLTRNYGEYLIKGRDKGNIRLRQLQWKQAERGSVAMLIWLGKQYLGQRDTPETKWENPVDGVEMVSLDEDGNIIKYI